MSNYPDDINTNCTLGNSPFTATAVHNYEIITLDVWGNNEDGFEVNDKFATGRFIELKDNATDWDVCQILKGHGLLLPGTRTRELCITDDGFDTITIDDIDNGQPLFELRRSN